MRNIKKLTLLTLGLVLVAGVLYVRTQYVVPVLMYHRIDHAAQKSKLSVAPKSFQKQLFWLKRWKTEVIPLQELVDALKTGEALHPKTRVVTFDDGYENFFTEAYPALKKYNVPATVFVVLAWVGKEGFMTWDQLQVLAKDPLVTLGSHTLSHAWLPSLDDEALRQELEGSRRLLQEGLGQPIRLLCYPAGAFDARVRSAAVAAGYEGAVATNPGPHYPDDDPYAVKRVRISRTSDNPLVFGVESSGFYTFLKEIRDEE